MKIKKLFFKVYKRICKICDLYFNKNKLKALSVRERLDVRNGEVIKSKTNVSLTNKIFKYFENIDGAIGLLVNFYNKNKDIYELKLIKISWRMHIKLLCWYEFSKIACK